MASTDLDLSTLFDFPKARGLKKLDKDAFRKTIAVPALRCPPPSCQQLVKCLQSRILRLSGIRSVTSDPVYEDRKLVFLSPGNGDASEYPATVQEQLASKVVELVSDYPLDITFDNLNACQALHAILPEDGGEVVKSFETVGHIAHMNLRASHEEYKRVIGEVILAKNPQIKTVVNKVQSIDTTFRTFSMEVLAGEQCTEVTLRENNCRFKFDFAKVFWNSRLLAEHGRRLKCFSQDDVICDVFAGVGPFAVPAARKGCRVYANDLNPESFACLEGNAKLNRVDGRLSAFCLDGRDFLRKITEEVTSCARQVAAGETDWFRAKYPMYTQVLMNLPALAIEFLDVFQGLLRPLEDLGVMQRPTVHCYCFSRASDPKADALERVEQSLGISLSEEVEVMCVRNVAPNKEMMRISFRLPPSKAWEESATNVEPPNKKPYQPSPPSSAGQNQVN